MYKSLASPVGSAVASRIVSFPSCQSCAPDSQTLSSAPYSPILSFAQNFDRSFPFLSSVRRMMGRHVDPLTFDGVKCEGSGNLRKSLDIRGETCVVLTSGVSFQHEDGYFWNRIFGVGGSPSPQVGEVIRVFPLMRYQQLLVADTR